MIAQQGECLLCTYQTWVQSPESHIVPQTSLVGSLSTTGCSTKSPVQKGGKGVRVDLGISSPGRNNLGPQSRCRS